VGIKRARKMDWPTAGFDRPLLEPSKSKKNMEDVLNLKNF